MVTAATRIWRRWEERGCRQGAHSPGPAPDRRHLEPPPPRHRRGWPAGCTAGCLFAPAAAAAAGPLLLQRSLLRAALLQRLLRALAGARGVLRDAQASELLPGRRSLVLEGVSGSLDGSGRRCGGAVFAAAKREGEEPVENAE